MDGPRHFHRNHSEICLLGLLDSMPNVRIIHDVIGDHRDRICFHLDSSLQNTGGIGMRRDAEMPDLARLFQIVELVEQVVLPVGLAARDFVEGSDAELDLLGRRQARGHTLSGSLHYRARALCPDSSIRDLARAVRVHSWPG
jgi:hypothetical protein